MKMKRRRLPFERIRVIVTQEHKASATTESFGRLWFKVGSWTALVLLLWALSFSLMHRHAEDIASIPKRTRGHDSVLLVRANSIGQQAATISSSLASHPLASEFDAFALMSQLQNLPPPIEASNEQTADLMKRRAQHLMSEFAQKYGGQGPDGITLARRLLCQAFDTVSSLRDGAAATNRSEHHASVVQMVARHLPSVFPGGAAPGASGAPSIRILCVGGAAAAGVGNYRGQAYSVVLERLLARLFGRADAEEEPNKPEPATVHHASVPDEEELPLLWCFLSQFDDDNLPTWIVWDFPLDDAASSTTKLEAFLRAVAARWRAAASQNHPPLLVFRLPLNARALSLLRYYESIAPDVLILDSARAAEPVLGAEASARPSGFADWSSFSGSATDAHSLLELLSVQHHEWIAWLLMMQLLAGLEHNAVLQADVRGADSKLKSKDPGRQALAKPLPKPKYVPTDRLWSSLVLGEHSADLKCYSSYMLSPYNAIGNKLEVPPGSESSEGNFALLPVTGTNREREPNHLNHLVIGGAVITRMENLLLPHASFYSQGWVLDLDLPSKRAKQRTAPDFLGFEDWKTTFFGTVASPPLALSLPPATQRLWLCESSSVSSLPPPSGKDDENGGCSLHRDVAFRINGNPVDRVELVEVVTAFEKWPCVEVPLPKARSSNVTDHSAHESSLDDFLEVTLQVTGTNMPHRHAPCSLAHVLYV